MKHRARVRLAETLIGTVMFARLRMGVYKDEDEDRDEERVAGGTTQMAKTKMKTKMKMKIYSIDPGVSL